MNAAATLRRENAIVEATLSAVMGAPYEELKVEALRTGRCEEADLHCLGRRILSDLVRLARGEVSAVIVPRRLPNRGEHSRSG